MRVHTPFLILGVWLLGGGLALLGAFIWAELAIAPARRRRTVPLPARGLSSFGRLRLWMGPVAGDADRRHGGSGRYVCPVLSRNHRPLVRATDPIAAVTLLGLTAINCLGVRAGSNVQSALMLLKAGAIAAMVVAGLLWGGGAVHPLPLLDRPGSLAWSRHRRGHDSGRLRIWRLADRELCRRRDARSASRFVPRPGDGSDRRRGALSRGEFRLSACARSGRLAATRIPASAVMRAALGERGARGSLSVLPFRRWVFSAREF